MGLGKTLQTICIVAGDHQEKLVASKVDCDWKRDCYCEIDRDYYDGCVYGCGWD